ncbi:MAG: hypothetical protein AAFS10_19645, partial [Myxococcota bacterium]
GVLAMTIPVPDGVVESLPVVSAVAATIAVPAWATYVKQSKAREAELNLKRLADGAMAFYLAERLNARGKVQPQRFPMSARSTPEPVRSCCARMGGPDADNDGQCDPNAVIWEQQGFREARFAPTTPQHFVYEIINNGKTGREAVLHLKAYGDLDCDGVTSEYSVTLEVNEGNEVTSTPVVVTDMDLELE